MIKFKENEVKNYNSRNSLVIQLPPVKDHNIIDTSLLDGLHRVRIFSKSTVSKIVVFLENEFLLICFNSK